MPCSFLSYWIGCSHLPLLTASQFHVIQVPPDVDQQGVLIVLIHLWEWISSFLGSVMLHLFELIQGVLGV